MWDFSERMVANWWNQKEKKRAELCRTFKTSRLQEVTSTSSRVKSCQMRFALLFFLSALFSVACAQSDPSNFYKSVVPDVTINIHKHPTGADMIEITMRAEGYPQDLLKSQIKKLGEYLHSEPRGVDVGSYGPDPAQPGLKFTKGEFAIDGVIDRKNGTFRINPFAQAMAGAPDPWTIHGMEIQFQGEVPTSEIPRRWPSQFVPGEGRFEGEKDSRLTGVEYRITLLSQDPTKFDIPEPGQKPSSQPQEKGKSNGLDWTSIVVFFVAVGAVGALVYSLLLRVRPKVSK